MSELDSIVKLQQDQPIINRRQTGGIWEIVNFWQICRCVSETSLFLFETVENKYLVTIKYQ